MTNDDSRITIHMVASLDGFIAAEDETIDWMYSSSTYEKGKTLADTEIAAFLNSIDCYVMGSRTYEIALQLGWPYGEKPVVVLTTRTLQSDNKQVDFRSGDLRELVVNELKPKYQNIWMVGGAALTKEFIRQDLADAIVISIMPVLLGAGTLFFNFIGKRINLKLIDVTAYKDGMVELEYTINP